jgi:nucleoside phosphorylase
MSRILVVAAVEAELAPFLAQTQVEAGVWCPVGNHEVLVAFTGIGAVAATFHIQRLLQQHTPDRIIQAGVAGAYPESGLTVGQTVQVVRERLADLGTVTGGRFSNPFAENQPLENPPIPTLPYPPVAGFTVNTGCADHFPQLLTLFADDRAAVETMEGYTLFYVCGQVGIPFLELRTISNLVTPNRDSWNLPLATENLATALTSTLKGNYEL